MKKKRLIMREKKVIEKERERHSLRVRRRLIKKIKTLLKRENETNKERD